MDPRLTTYIDRVRTACAEPLAPRTRLKRICDAARELASEPVDLSPEHRFAPAGAYGRNLLHRDAEHGFVVVAMVWPPGAGGLPHDHETWGVSAVTEGTVRVIDFEREDDGSRADHAILTPRCTIDAGPGSVASVLPPHDDYHQVSNPSQSELAISIHTYGKDIESCHVFDPVRQSCEILHPEYTNPQ
jgi:predicted metal-dependent enzyme (double-stranded beta helix superfamily)